MGDGELVMGGRAFRPSSASPLVMGILNASPDSFSDGALVSTVDRQVARGLAMVADGADLIDVGGESGATGVPPLTPAEEIARVVPVVRELAAAGAAVSVDTWKPAVAEAVLAAGAVLVNDVSGLHDPALADVCAAHGAGLVVMHTSAAPKTEHFPPYGDVVAEVVDFLRRRIDLACARGVAPSSIVADPGPDFTKTPAQTVALLRRLPEVVALGFPVLLALSRKEFIGALLQRRPLERDAGTLAALAAGLDAGGSLVRVHDVRAVRDYLCIRAALRGGFEVPAHLTVPVPLRHESRLASGGSGEAADVTDPGGVGEVPPRREEVRRHL